MLLQGFEATISIEDGDEYKELEEHKVEFDGDDKASAYICSADGASFCVNVSPTNAEENRDVQIKLVMDGNTLDTVWAYQPTISSCFSTDGFYVSKTERTKFLFSTIDRAEPSGVPAPTSQCLGSIEILLFLIKDVTHVPRTYWGRKHEPASVDDRALKQRKKEQGVPLSHRVRFGSPETEQALEDIQMIWQKVRPEPLATFRFNYASRDVLEACSVIARAQEGEEDEEEDDAAPEAGDFTQELQASNDKLKRKLSRLERKLAEMRRGGAGSSQSGSVIIDLTGDDEDVGSATLSTVVLVKDEDEEGPADEADGPREAKRARTSGGDL